MIDNNGFDLKTMKPFVIPEAEKWDFLELVKGEQLVGFHGKMILKSEDPELVALGMITAKVMKPGEKLHENDIDDIYNKHHFEEQRQK